MPFTKHIYSRWIRTSPDSDEFDRTKVRLLLMFCFIGIAISSFYFFVQPIIPFNVPRPTFALLPALLVFGCLLLLAKVHHHHVAHFVIFSFYVCFLIGVYYSGGIKSLVLPWLSLMPVMATLLTDHRSSVYWFWISFGSILVFVFISDSMLPAAVKENSLRNVFSNIGLCLILFLFTSLFDRARYKILKLLRARNEDLAAKQIIIQQKNKTLEQHWNTLIEVSKNKTINFGTLEEALNHIAVTTARSLHVSRASIWLYHVDDATKERIECVSAFNREENNFYRDENLYRDDNREYFKAIKSERIIAADDVQEHRDTKAFSDKYLKPWNICSMMDAPFFLDGKLAGVLCCEHQNEKKRWTAEDIIFATSMAEIVSLAFRSASRRLYEKELKNLSRKVKKQNDLLKKKSDELNKINQNLEENVQHRTRELLTKNRQLAEYAFINAHLLRGPLCRILGLINLMEYAELNGQDHELLERLKLSGRELDDVVNRINDAIMHDSEVDVSNFFKQT